MDTDAMGAETTGVGPTAPRDRLTGPGAAMPAVTRVLVRAVRALGQSGRVVQASRLAADGWTVLRHDHPAEAEHLNGVLHYLARLPEADPRPTEAQPDTPDDTGTGSDMTTQDQRLDVRTELPARRHELIFDTYAALQPGQAFELVNDHDPKPLYYQFAAEHAGQFTWDYQEEGPQTWRVRIGRTAEDSNG